MYAFAELKGHMLMPYFSGPLQGIIGNKYSRGKTGWRGICLVSRTVRIQISCEIQNTMFCERNCQYVSKNPIKHIMQAFTKRNGHSSVDLYYTFVVFFATTR